MTDTPRTRIPYYEQVADRGWICGTCAKAIEPGATAIVGKEAHLGGPFCCVSCLRTEAEEQRDAAVGLPTTGAPTAEEAREFFLTLAAETGAET